MTYIHGDTTHCWPAISLGLVLPVRATSLQDGFVSATTARDNACKWTEQVINTVNGHELNYLKLRHNSIKCINHFGLNPKLMLKFKKSGHMLPSLRRLDLCPRGRKHNSTSNTRTISTISTMNGSSVTINGLLHHHIKSCVNCQLSGRCSAHNCVWTEPNPTGRFEFVSEPHQW